MNSEIVGPLKIYEVLKTQICFLCALAFWNGFTMSLFLGHFPPEGSAMREQPSSHSLNCKVKSPLFEFTFQNSQLPLMLHQTVNYTLIVYWELVLGGGKIHVHVFFF